MEEISKLQIENKLHAHRAFFATHQTKEISFRKKQLKSLKTAIRKYEGKIVDALFKDLRKSFEESFLTEISIVLQEIDLHIENLSLWSGAKKVETPFHLLPSSSEIQYEPLGVALIIAPWNYPFQLLMNPLVGAISSGCCALLKPSPDAPNIALVMHEMISETYEENYISLLQGEKEVNVILLQQRFDLIFFTGSSSVGKIIMKAAAEFLTPVILELGGKSPCIVDADANIDLAAKRIAWGKTINAGQTCIAPDYLFAHASIKNELVEKIAFQIEAMYGKNIQENKFYPRIINLKAMDRLQKLMKDGVIKFGGIIDREDRFISPTIIDEVKLDFPIMQEEIFGPILPVLSFENIDEPIRYVNAMEKPLAFYYFGSNRKAKEILAKTSSGGACINDTIMHIANHHLPFGGVGNSGIGKYHGHSSFFAFSNERAVVITPTWIDLPMKYAPFKYFNFIRRII